MNPEKIKKFLSYYIAEIFLIWVVLLFYYKCPFYKSFLAGLPFKTLFCLAVAYSIAAIPLFIYYTIKGKPSKGYLVIGIVSKFLIEGKSYLKNFISNEETKPFSLDKESRTLLLFTLVKFFYIPVMTKFMFTNLLAMNNRFDTILSSTKPLFTLISGNYFLLLIAFFFFIDTAFYLFGYLAESSFLNNKVKSVDSTFFGWAVALACYPPFNKVVSVVIPLHENFSITYGNEGLTLVVRVILILLLFIFVASSVSLGTRCSNLTNRGIVSNGTYSIIRHPAYISKILIWWILLIPVIPMKTTIILNLLAWTILYFLRAITEEQHLIQDPAYKKYCEKVKYRFIPFVF
ncbi:MAG: DUF1295 domain-containing protein [Bacteroidia bacterium]|nr:DUF1295 domain-containing protein [Bacteroidia bacterium]